ncbi:hypothetical protein NMY22_g18078 [Coprinellus aureogranulatus]|nr:hypothetical protein NMY22_g18078 [Coprinellus aureogranulatus]
MVDALSAFTSEVTGVAPEVETPGILGAQASPEGVQVAWADFTRNLNQLGSDLTGRGRSVSEVMKAVAANDWMKFVNIDVMPDLKIIVDSTVSQPNTSANEVTQASLKVGMEGTWNVEGAHMKCRPIGHEPYGPGTVYRACYKTASTAWKIRISLQERTIAVATTILDCGEITQ